MRILLINDNGIEVGGAETYLLNLKKGLIAAGHEVRIMTSDHGVNEEGKKNVIPRYSGAPALAFANRINSLARSSRRTL